MSLGARIRRCVLAFALVSGFVTVLSVTHPAVAATVLPAKFQEQVIFSGLDQPTNIEFAPDNRVFVAEKKGVIKVFPSIADPVPTIVADLSTEVNSEWDRGLLGMALGPNFATDPWLYILYTYDAPLGQTAPVWNDKCPNATDGTCVVSARLSRIRIDGDHMTGTEQVLISDWCQQFPSHSIGDLQFGSDGALYLTAGEGASFNVTDYGQLGAPVNPCGDPPGGVNGSMTTPTAEGGSLRAQDVRTTGDPAGLSGALLRLDPNTGQAMADNPNAGSPDPNARRIVAYGLRNPYRFALRPGTSEVWVGDVGQSNFEEINRVVSPTAGVTNFGWPCYEGGAKHPAFANLNVNLCQSLYADGGATDPYYSYAHGSPVVPNEACSTAGGSVSGMAFYPQTGGAYPGYQGALFFADYTRNCIWAMKATTVNGTLQPDPTKVETFATQASTPVDLELGPGGELYYVDLSGGTVRRFRYFDGNQPPTAVIASSATGGAVPLTVNFDGTGSTDPDPGDKGLLTYAWDFGDGTPVSTAAKPSHTYTTKGTFAAKLTVTDTAGATNTATLNVTPGNNAPTAVIDTPTAATTWKVGDPITFSGHATDLQDGTEPASALTWHLRIHHCATTTSCHVHDVDQWNGVSGGSFTAPDHAYPSYLELELDVTDKDGLTSSVVRRLDPKTVALTFSSTPPGMNLTIGDFTGKAPFTQTVIQNSSQSISAGPPQAQGVTTYTWSKWSDGGASAHQITAPTTAATYSATYAGVTPKNLALSRPATGSASCNANEVPAKAVNGTWTTGTADKFCSKAAGAFLQVDLGAVSSIGTIVLSHAGAGGEAATNNTKDFNLAVSSDGTTWQTVTTVTGNTASVTTHPVNTIGRYVRLNVTTPTSSGDVATRIYEMQVFAPAAIAAPPAPTDLALNHPTTSSAPCAATETGAQAVNGTWTHGASDKFCTTAADKWLQVDLGAVSNIGKVVIHHAGAGGESAAGNTRDFTIQASVDGTTWTTAATITGNTANVTTNLVTAVGRYLRINVQTATSNNGTAARIYELEVFAPRNLVVGRPSVADATCNTNEVAAKAFNGSWTGGTSDKWCSQVAPRWIEADLGSMADIGTFVIYHAAGGGEAATGNTRDFTIQVSPDGVTWTTVVTVTGNTDAVTTHPVTAAGRFIRLNVTTPTNNGGPAARIYEIQVMGVFR